MIVFSLYELLRLSSCPLSPTTLTLWKEPGGLRAWFVLFLEGLFNQKRPCLLIQTHFFVCCEKHSGCGLLSPAALLFTCISPYGCNSIPWYILNRFFGNSFFFFLEADFLLLQYDFMFLPKGGILIFLNGFTHKTHASNNRLWEPVSCRFRPITVHGESWVCLLCQASGEWTEAPQSGSFAYKEALQKPRGKSR